MKYLFTLLSILCFFSLQELIAQENKNKFNDKFDDVFEEEENENLTLRFFNALTGDPIEGGKIILGGSYEFESDKEGKIRFPVPDADGLIKVRFEKVNFISSDFTIEVIAGTLFFNRFSVSPALDLKEVRIVLDWDNDPKDLDAHFIKNNGYHLSYRNTKILLDGRGELDRDDMDGYGPETITVRDIDDLGSYTYKVHDFTNRNNVSNRSLCKSKASVKIYGKGRLLYLFQIPSQKIGTTWEVFKIVDGEFIEVNQIKN